MKLCTFEYEGLDKVGIVLDRNRIADITVAYASCLYNRGEDNAYKLANALTPPSMIELIEGGKSSINSAKEAMQYLMSSPDIKGPKGERIFYPLTEVRLKAPIPRPPKILAAVRNQVVAYESATKPSPHHPYYFIKLSTSVTGPYDPIEIPDVGIVGTEVEVGAIIGKKGKNIPLETAEEYIFGYTVVNDITAHQMRQESEWIIIRTPKGEEETLSYSSRYKCFDTFAPMGPWLVTRDEIANIYNCKIETRINNKDLQRGNLADMNFKFPELISYFSHAHTLEPGDVIFSGTCPAAVGLEMFKIDLRKMAGGILESEVEGIGTLKNPIKAV